MQILLNRQLREDPPVLRDVANPRPERCSAAG
jgi:hypothetical protein